MSVILYRKVKLLEEINKFIDKNKLQLFVLVIVNIKDMDSTILVSGSLYKVVETAFNVEIHDNEAFLKGISSRKKEVYPYIANVINELPKSENNHKWVKLNILLFLILFLLI